MVEEKRVRQPNLGTILMVESILKKQDSAISLPNLKRALPRQVMHQTLKVILSYLWESKKIEYTPDGVRWVFVR